ncbi:MAG: hypothetical protein RBS89_03655 [Candidatus Delongbacteria bacterium]|jgi:hypothetical protein|nr:hypothetical protein [Candidatus Delongbacteria bacterium]
MNKDDLEVNVKLKEKEWVKEKLLPILKEKLLPILIEKIKTKDNDLCVAASKRIMYANEIFKYTSSMDQKEIITEQFCKSNFNLRAYETDLLIYEKKNDNSWVPRVIIEVKMKSISTHGCIDYAHKANQHKIIHPYIRYGVLISDVKSGFLSGRMFRHGMDFDFLIAWSKREPDKLELNKFVEIMVEEVKTSRKLEGILLEYNKKKHEKIKYMHRKLILE